MANALSRAGERTWDNALTRYKQHVQQRSQSVSEDEVQFGVNPIDELRRTVNTRSYTPEQAAQNREAAFWELLGVIPGPGNAISAYDAYTGAGDAHNAFQKGDYKGGALSSALAGLSGAGAVLGLPVGKFAKGAAEAGKDSLYAIPAWHGSPHEFDKFEFSPRTVKTGAGDNFYGEGLSFSNDRNYAKGYAGDGGRLYQVELDVGPTDLVSSHDPLWFQGLAGKRAVAALEASGVQVDHGDGLLSLFHKGHDFTKLAKILKDAGMKGLSVGNQGDPLEYVIFDDRLVKILGKE